MDLDRRYWMRTEFRPDPSTPPPPRQPLQRSRLIGPDPLVCTLFAFNALAFCSRPLELLLGSHFQVKPCVSAGKRGWGAAAAGTGVKMTERRVYRGTEENRGSVLHTLEQIQICSTINMTGSRSEQQLSQAGDIQNHMLPTAAAGPQKVSLKIRRKCRSPGAVQTTTAIWFAPCVFRNLFFVFLFLNSF